MRTIKDPGQLLADGLAAIRAEFQLPAAFPPAALAEARAAAAAPDLAAHADRTALPLVTLDPAAATDLDQAFAIEPADGGDLLLTYAIADVGAFIGLAAPDTGGALTAEAWARGASQYLPDGKVSLYPPLLSEGAASLLPDVDRPALLYRIRVAADGGVRLDGLERALVRSRAKLAYETATQADLPAGLAELARRIAAAESARGASRSAAPEQEVVDAGDHYALRLRPQGEAERHNAALSLATNLAVADLLLANRTGLFRVMAPPADWAVRRLRHAARGLGIDWPKSVGIAAMEAGLDPAVPAEAALILAIRRAGPGASYAAFDPAEPPFHSAVAAAYVHATAPLRRLADLYVGEAALALANGKPLPAACAAAFPALPKVMARADSLSGRIERAVVDLAEAVVLQDRVGETFRAVVTDQDERGARLQLCDLPVIARIAAPGIAPGQGIAVRLDAADPGKRRLDFSLAASGGEQARGQIVE